MCKGHFIYVPTLIEFYHDLLLYKPTIVWILQVWAYTSINHSCLLDSIHLRRVDWVMRLRIRFHECELRVDARKTGFNAHSIRIRGYVWTGLLTSPPCAQPICMQACFLSVGGCIKLDIKSVEVPIYRFPGMALHICTYHMWRHCLVL